MSRCVDDCPARRCPLACLVGALFIAASVTAHAQAQPSVPNDGGLHQWVTVGAPGNAPYMGNPGNLPAFGRERELLLGAGSVNYEFRISRTELTHSQYLQFRNDLMGSPTTLSQLNAYFSAHPASINISGQLPPGFNIVSNGPSGTQTYALSNPGWADVPVQVTWREAALYCNWLQNGRVSTFDAFMTGAYNVYSWGDNGNGTITDDASRMAGAQFFIPNLNESIKAAHYDPNRYGPNQGGYWLYGNSTDAAPVFGTPGTLVNGQPVTATTPGGIFTPRPVGSLPDQQSPWGLWDSVGMWNEWVENAPYSANGLSDSRIVRGNRVDGAGWANVYNLQSATLRIASIVPSPGPVAVMGLGFLVAARRRR